MPVEDDSIGIIHHLSATGGTVISRCLAAMPDVVLLSELHPLAASLAFYPLDPFGQVAWNYPDLLPPDDRMYFLFRERLAPVRELCRAHGKNLILRDHSHSDYLTARAPEPRLANALRSNFKLRQIVTIRNPIDAWLGIVENGFDTHLSGFEQYCERYVRFLDDYAGLPLWRYEDFVAHPDEVTRSMCAELGIPFLAGFAERAAKVTMTGDSGRRPKQIGKLPRRDASASFLAYAANLPAYREISERHNYDPPA